MIRENNIYGQKPYLTGRYGYSAIDNEAEGHGTILTALKPKKLAAQILGALLDTQERMALDLLTAIQIGDSGHSEELYLYATNDRNLYDLWLRPCLVSLKLILDEKNTSKNAQDWNNLIHSLNCAFARASRKYSEEFKEDYRVFTQLDISMCIYSWLEFYKGEYRCNRLAGYESEENRAV